MESRLKEIEPASVVLNVGSGGDIERTIRASLGIDKRIISVDVDPGRHPQVTADVCELPFADGQFDAVCLMEVLEHVHAPARAIDEIYRVLRPGGTLIFSVPFLFPLHDRPYDYYRFTRYGLELLLRSFETVNVVERNTYGEAVAVLMMRLLKESGYGPKAVGAAFLALGSLPFNLIFNQLVQSDAGTTGYAGSARRPSC